MLLCFSLCIALSLLGTALSGPLDEYLHRAYEPAYAPASMQEYPAANVQYNSANEQGDDGSQEAKEREIPLPAADVQYNYVNMQGDDGSQEATEGEVPLPASLRGELEKQLKRGHPTMAEMQAQGDAAKLQRVKYLMQGSTIGIQMYRTKYKWLSCPKNNGYCSTGTCPSLFMENDWNRCHDNVFQIYHPSGPGPIVVGDLVGLYYPNDRKWFSMYRNKGHKQTCPGTPNMRTGFWCARSWRGCGAEVFRIYVKGKRNGQRIEDHDIISLKYGHLYVRLDYSSGRYPDLANCPLYHPHDRYYDVCQNEVFEVSIR